MGLQKPDTGLRTTAVYDCQNRLVLWRDPSNTVVYDPEDYNWFRQRAVDQGLVTTFTYESPSRPLDRRLGMDEG